MFRGVLGVYMVYIWCMYMHNGRTQVYVRAIHVYKGCIKGILEYYDGYTL